MFAQIPLESLRLHGNVHNRPGAIGGRCNDTPEQPEIYMQAGTEHAAAPHRVLVEP